jgi:hypothetical protein
MILQPFGSGGSPGGETVDRAWPTWIGGGMRRVRFQSISEVTIFLFR